MQRVLIANRGEIAVRIVRACRKLGLQSVVAVSTADRDSLAARLADRAVCIGPARAAGSYLNIPAILAVAKGAGADAVHPGYGFLSENPAFASACVENGLQFVGPNAEAIRVMGRKIEARTLARRHGVPVAQGADNVGSADEALAAATAVGFPILLKAAAGGGGRGIRIVEREEDLKAAFQGAAAEAEAAFGDRTLYLERYVANARHIEIQVLGDRFGSILHLGERDCSCQRRYQKIIESGPAEELAPGALEGMRSAAIALAQSVGYESAGTVEFIYDQDRGTFYFMEMNTRVQVEHPVTEMITGVDIVEQQLRVAAGERLGFAQADVRIDGHALECRINAESPLHGFRPCPGTIAVWHPPAGEGVRVDTHCFAGSVVTPFYDSLLAKVIVHAHDRRAAVQGMVAALDAFTVEGVDTTLPMLRTVLRRPEFLAGPVNTRWLERCVQDLAGVDAGIS